MMKENKRNSKLLKVLKKIKFRHFIVLALLLIADTYAWLIYVNTVNNNIDVHVRSWNIDFTDGSNPIVDYVNVTADDVYPGMTTFTNTIHAFNYSEVLAEARFVILEGSIMGTDFTTVEGRAENGEVVNQADLTSDQMRTKLASDYPFAITFSVSSVSLEAETGDASFVTQISWPYESGDDEEDTQWGNMAYTFKQAHPNDPCISLRVKIYITQAANQPSNNNEPEEPEP